MKYCLGIVDANRSLWFVAGYNNTLAEPTRCAAPEFAMEFNSYKDAHAWGSRYLLAYNWCVLVARS